MKAPQVFAWRGTWDKGEWISELRSIRFIWRPGVKGGQLR
jgi:hypothetical protein